jgi:hypothetical protein
MQVKRAASSCSALPVVSEWCQYHARFRVTPELLVDPGVMVAWRRRAA